jgi:hypothetical protein
MVVVCNVARMSMTSTLMDCLGVIEITLFLCYLPLTLCILVLLP